MIELIGLSGKTLLSRVLTESDVLEPSGLLTVE